MKKVNLTKTIARRKHLPGERAAVASSGGLKTIKAWQFYTLCIFANPRFGAYQNCMRRTAQGKTVSGTAE